MTQPANFKYLRAIKQRGVVLFLALIALVALSLAAVALIRSVDTSTLIAGNIAFKQSATTSADAGVESAIAWLTGVQSANSSINVLTNATHPFNITNAANGYYSNANSIDLFADATWSISTIPAVTDSSGNTVSYIIERMCRTADVAIQNADCLFSDAVEDSNGQQIALPQDVCDGDGCPVAGQTPQIRITARATGPKNSVSYVQAFVY
jgi:Tfp pilus assembly protein PilX